MLKRARRSKGGIYPVSFKIKAIKRDERGVKKYKVKKRERFLNREELRRPGDLLWIEEEFAPLAVACMRLLLLAGYRLGEIQTLKWS